jgi:hypothetical protein
LGFSANANARFPASVAKNFACNTCNITPALAHQLIKCSLVQFSHYQWPYTYAYLRDAFDVGKLAIWCYDIDLYILEIDGVDVCVLLEY